MMKAMPRSPGIARGHLSWLSFTRMTLDPVIAVATYSALAMLASARRSHG